MEPVDRTIAAFEVADIEGEVNDLRERGMEVEGVITVPGGVRGVSSKTPTATSSG